MPAHAVAVPQEARPEHVVGAAASDGVQDALEVDGLVLAIPVDVDGRGIALVASDLETGPQRGPEPARDRVRVHPRTELPPDVRSGVTRAVVDEQRVDGEAARLAWNPSKNPTDGSLLIARHDDRKTAMRTRLRRNRPA